MTHKAKPILIVVGAILIAMFPLSRWIASEYLRNVPRVYFSVVTIEIRGLGDCLGGTEPQFLVATRFQIIKKAQILNPVIEKLDLVKKLSPPGMTMPFQWVTETLARSIVVQEKPNTSLIEIGVYNADRQLAADIANTIAVTYRDKRIENMRKERDLTLAEMKDELKTRREEMGQLFQEAARIRLEDNIVDPDPDNSDTVLTFNVERVFGGSEMSLEEKRAFVDQLRNQLARIEQLKPEKLMEALRILSISDETVEKTLPLLQDAKAEEAKLLSTGFGADHPRVKSVRAQREVYAKVLSDQLESIKRALKTKLGIEEATLKTHEEQMGSGGKAQIDEKTRMNRYVKKKSDYLMTKQLLLSLQQRNDAARIETPLIQAPVTIWQRAEPSQIPARPDAVAILRLANAIGGSLGGIGVLLILIAVCIKSPRVHVNTNTATNGNRKD